MPWGPVVAELPGGTVTLLFTDIEGSTRLLRHLGERYAEVLAAHHQLLRAAFGAHGGHEVDTAGDGFLATFDGPARAIRAALAIRDAVRRLGVEIRAGLHTGEVQLREGGIGGLAVHIGARVAARAGTGEVMVSRTVKDLVAGSGIQFEDRGSHTLKGVPDQWRLFAVARN